MTKTKHISTRAWMAAIAAVLMALLLLPAVTAEASSTEISGSRMGGNNNPPSEAFKQQWTHGYDWTSSTKYFGNGDAGEHNCTYYVGYMLTKNGASGTPNYGNATAWRGNAQANGYTVDNNPAVGSIAYWSPDYGHVAYVEEVGANYIIISEDSWFSDQSKMYFRWRNITKDDAAYPEAFLHIADTGAAPPAQQYTVTFKDWNGATLETQTVSHGNSAALPNNPTRVGYSFTGWDKALTNITSDTIISALYEIQKYTVTFTDGTGGVIGYAETEYQKSATAPNPPNIEGSTFIRWDRAFASVTGDMTVNAVYGKNDGVVDVSGGDRYSLILMSDKTLLATGRNNRHQLGDGTTVNKKSPVQILTDVKVISAGIDHSLAVKNDNTLWVWGSNDYGQLGDGTTTERNTPRQVLTNVLFAYAGDSFSMAIRTDGSLWTWGKNNDGQLGDGTRENRYTPLKIMEDVTMASTNRDTAAALKTDGTVWFWGLNRSAITITPKKVTSNCIYVSVAGSNSGHYSVVFCINTNGSLYQHESMSSSGSKIADNVLSVSAGFCQSTRYSYISQGDPYTKISISQNVDNSYTGHYLRIKTDGSLWASGYNDDGAFGNNASASGSSNYVTVEIKIWPHKATFKNWDDSVLSTQLLWRGTAAQAPTTPTRTGYVFSGWESSFSNVTADITVYAAFVPEAQVPAYTVTFKDWNGTTLKTQSVRKGTAASAPTNPVRDGYAFIGWDKAFDFIDGDLTVTAQYSEITTPTLTIGSATGAPGSTVSVPVTIVNNPGIAGFTFALSFDNTKLTPTEIVPGVILPSSITSNINAGGDLSELGSVTANLVGTSNFAGNGVLFTIKFTVNENAQESASALTLTKSDVTDQGYHDIELAVIPGQLNIVEFKYGNIFSGSDGGDTEVDIKDAVKLAQHLAGWNSAALTSAEEKAADVYPDNVVDIKDAVKLAQFLAGWPGVILGVK
jgi:surface antigen